MSNFCMSLFYWKILYRFWKKLFDTFIDDEIIVKVDIIRFRFFLIANIVAIIIIIFLKLIIDVDIGLES